MGGRGPPDGDLVGRAGLYRGPDWPGVEVAWTIRHDRWGEGLATEGGAAALEYAFDRLGLDRVVCLMHPDNGASGRVAEKLGLTLDAVAPFHGEPTCHYWITRAAWTTTHAA